MTTCKSPAHAQYRDAREGLTESAALARAAKIEYDRMTPEKQAEVAARWAATPEWKKQQLRDEIEMDLL